MDEPRGSPPWLRDGVNAAWREIRSYLGTAWAFTRSGYRFMQEWSSGQRVALNPLAMLATAAALTAASHQLAGAVTGLPHPDGLIDAALSAAGPYAHYVAIGLLCHVVVAPGAPRRAGVLDSVAAALYAGAGPAALAEAIGWLLICAVWPFAPSPIALAVMLGVAFSIFTTTLAIALSSLHGSSPARNTLSFLVAFSATGLVFGMLHPPGSYGLHWVLDLRSGFFLGLGM